MFRAIDLLTGEPIDASRARHRGNQYLCPWCRARVHLRSGFRQLRDPHFAHDPGMGSPECEEYYPGLGAAGSWISDLSKQAPLPLVLVAARQGNYYLAIMVPPIYGSVSGLRVGEDDALRGFGSLSPPRERFALVPVVPKVGAYRHRCESASDRRFLARVLQPTPALDEVLPNLFHATDDHAQGRVFRRIRSDEPFHCGDDYLALCRRPLKGPFAVPFGLLPNGEEKWILSRIDLPLQLDDAFMAWASSSFAHELPSPSRHGTPQAEPPLTPEPSTTGSSDGSGCVGPTPHELALALGLEFPDPADPLPTTAPHLPPEIAPPRTASRETQATPARAQPDAQLGSSLHRIGPRGNGNAPKALGRGWRSAGKVGPVTLLRGTSVDDGSPLILQELSLPLRTSPSRPRLDLRVSSLMKLSTNSGPLATSLVGTYGDFGRSFAYILTRPGAGISLGQLLASGHKDSRRSLALYSSLRPQLEPFSDLGIFHGGVHPELIWIAEPGRSLHLTQPSLFACTPSSLVDGAITGTPPRGRMPLDDAAALFHLQQLIDEDTPPRTSQGIYFRARKPTSSAASHSNSAFAPGRSPAQEPTPARKAKSSDAIDRIPAQQLRAELHWKKALEHIAAGELHLARSQLSQAAHAGNMDAAALLACYFLTGIGGKTDDERARKWLRTLAQKSPPGDGKSRLDKVIEGILLPSGLLTRRELMDKLRSAGWLDTSLT